jgi:hypothetical protein
MRVVLDSNVLSLKKFQKIPIMEAGRFKKDFAVGEA